MINVGTEQNKIRRGIGAPPKIYALITLASLVSFGASYLLSTGTYVGGIVLLVVFLTLFAVNALLIDTKRPLVFGVIANAVAFALPFLRLFSWSFIIGFIVLTVFLWDGAYRARRNIDNMVKIRFGHLVRSISRSMLTAVLVFLSIIIVMSADFSVSRNGVDRALVVATPVMGRFVDGFSGEIRTEDLLINVVEKQLASNKNYIALPARERRAVLENQVEVLMEKLEKSVGVEIDPDVSVGENVYKLIDAKLSALTPRTQMYWGAIVVAILWLSIQSIEFIIYIPLAVLVFLVYEFLFATKFATLQMETKSKEVISLK